MANRFGRRGAGWHVIYWYALHMKTCPGNGHHDEIKRRVHLSNDVSRGGMLPVRCVLDAQDDVVLAAHLLYHQIFRFFGRLFIKKSNMYIYIYITNSSNKKKEAKLLQKGTLSNSHESHQQEKTNKTIFRWPFLLFYNDRDTHKIPHIILHREITKCFFIPLIFQWKKKNSHLNGCFWTQKWIMTPAFAIKSVNFWKICTDSDIKRERISPTPPHMLTAPKYIYIYIYSHHEREREKKISSPRLADVARR